MITFFADLGFELDLSDTSITLVEENDLFFNYFISGYSLPFTTNVKKFSTEAIRFLHLENVKLTAARFEGQLLVNDKYKKAVLSVQKVKGEALSGIIYYGDTTIALLETKLADLPFPIITTTSLTAYAKSILDKKYPEVGFNFPMIIDEDFKETSNYNKFEDIVNNYTGLIHPLNTLENEGGDTVVYNRNVLSPLPLYKEILRVGCEFAGLLFAGDLINDAVFEKLHWDTGKYLEKFSNSSEELHVLTTPTDSYIDQGVIISEYANIFNAGITGTYKLNMLLNLPSSLVVRSFKVFHLGEEIYSNASNNLAQEISINVPDNTSLGPVEVVLITEASDQNIEPYNNFDFQATGDKVNVFPNTFSLSQVMPDMTFGAFLSKLKTWFKLKVEIRDNILQLDYIDRKLVETVFKDKRAYELKEPLKLPSAIKAFELAYGETDIMYLDDSGRVYDVSGYNANEIETIPMEVKMLPIEQYDTFFTAIRDKKDPVFKSVLYDGLQGVNNLPLCVEYINGRNYSLPEVYERYHKRWIRFILNSTTFTDSFTTPNAFEFNIKEGQFKYNQKHLLYKISKKRVSEDLWQITVESKTLT